VTTTASDKKAGGGKDVYLRLPKGLKDRLKALTVRSRRSMNMEAVVAIEAWVYMQEKAAGKKGGKR
jgi:hypothetical protein